MVKKGKIAHYRQKLDHTLASLDLTDEKKLEALVKDQILQSLEDENRDYAENVIKKRTADVLNLLQMLRSASENYDASSDNSQHASWKLKQDNEEFRVMYREGPVGSPFHSLLVEGYIDAPLDVCLCVSWETALYQRWFPEIFIPTFKVVLAKSLQKVRIGEEVSILRMKLSWPMSSREAILHCFEFEYLEDGLVIVLLNTISEVADIKMETHGFTNDGIPEAGNTVRVDLIGGYALQKVTDNRSYFRTIGNMDLKLDFVPPSLINFIARQLIGTGFRFYQKMVASIAKGDDDFSKALTDPLYVRVREAVMLNNTSKGYLESQTNEEHISTVEDVSKKDDMEIVGNGHNGSLLRENPSNNDIDEEKTENSPDMECENVLGSVCTYQVEDQKILDNECVNGYAIHYKPATEIEEEETEEVKNRVKSFKLNNVGDTKEHVVSIDQYLLENLHKKVVISPEVEQALGSLDKMITIVREGKLRAKRWQGKSSMEAELDKAITMEKHLNWGDKINISIEEETTKADGCVPMNLVDGLRSKHSDSETCTVHHNSGAQIQLPLVTNSSGNSPSVGSSPAYVSPMMAEANGIHEHSPAKSKKSGQQKKWRLCCLHLFSRKLIS